MAFGFTCDICNEQVSMPKHITGLKTGLLSVCNHCHQDLLKYAKHLKKKRSGE